MKQVGKSFLFIVFLYVLGINVAEFGNEGSWLVFQRLFNIFGGDGKCLRFLLFFWLAEGAWRLYGSG